MISIVTAYYNRKQLFINTLKSINNSKIKDIEVIAVDDCSDDEHRLEDLINEYPFLRVIRLEKKNKWYINPCVPFNIGFKEAKGDIIVIQNPECLHIGDVLEYASKINVNEYVSFGCYSVDKSITDKINGLIEFSDDEILNSFTLQQKRISHDGDTGWYNHSIFRPTEFHFASVIHKSNLDKLNGFDERFAHGIAYDDNELLIRIKRLGLKVNIVDNPFVIHQWHYSSSAYKELNAADLIKKNERLWFNVVQHETEYKAN